MLELVCPSGTDNVCSRRTGVQFPCLVLYDRLVFSVHCPLPLSPIFPIQNILIMHGCGKSTLPKIPRLCLTSRLSRSLILVVLRERWRRRSGNSRSSWDGQYLNLHFY